MKVKNHCPNCYRYGMRAISFGLPVWLCSEELSCGTIWGFWSWLVPILNWNDVYMIYDHEKLIYPEALWYWLTCEIDDYR